MGNCIDLLCCSSAENSRVILHNGGEKEFQASTRVTIITRCRYHGYKLAHSALPYAPLPPNTRLQPGEVYYLMPSLVRSSTPKVSSKLASEEPFTRRKVKILLTRRQLELLLRNAKEFKSKAIKLRFGDRKWQPSLGSILEVPKF